MAMTDKQRSNNIINSVKWTKEEEAKLLKLFHDNWDDPMDVPWYLLAEKMPGRTERAIRSKLYKLLKAESEALPKNKSDIAFNMYLDGCSLKEIHEKLDTELTLEQVDADITKRREVAVKVIRAYAEERQIPVAKTLTSEVIKYFRIHYKTTNDFQKNALYKRIKDGR